MICQECESIQRLGDCGEECRFVMIPLFVFTEGDCNSRVFGKVLGVSRVLYVGAKKVDPQEQQEKW